MGINLVVLLDLDRLHYARRIAPAHGGRVLNGVVDHLRLLGGGDTATDMADIAGTVFDSMVNGGAGQFLIDGRGCLRVLPDCMMNGFSGNKIRTGSPVIPGRPYDGMMHLHSGRKLLSVRCLAGLLIDLA